MLMGHSNSRFSSITTSRIYLIFLALAVGVAFGCLPLAASIFDAVSELTDNVKNSVFPGCIFLLLFAALSGLSVIGTPAVLSVDLLLGFFVSAAFSDFRLSDILSSQETALNVLSVYILIFSCIYISDKACGFSKVLCRHLCGSKTISSDMLKYAAAVTAVLVFLVVLFLLQSI